MRNHHHEDDTMTIRKRLEHLENRRPAAERSDGRRRLSEFIETLAARVQPTDQERAEAQDWAASEWPVHLGKLRGKLAARAGE